MIIYRGLYKDIETNEANENIQVEKRIDLIDQESNPYNIVVTSAIVGPNRQFTFTFDTLPATAFQTQIVWSNDGGLNWSGAVGGTTSPQQITLPDAVYLFQFVVYFPDNVTVTWNSEDEIIPLEMTDDPVRVSVIDNDEDKFTPVRAKQLAIQIYSSNTISIRNFAEGGDTRFKVNYYVADVLHFTGFLSAGDLSQELLPDPNVINLIAVDGLGFLNDIPLTDFDGENPTNENSILDYLCWALKGTGLQLNIRVMFNIREVTAQDLNNDATGAGHLFKWCYLDAKTFEAEPGLSEDSYNVLSKILGEEGFIFQHLGEWRIMRIDEIEHGLLTGTWFQWNYQGNFLGKFDETHEASIGEGEDHSWMNDDQQVFVDRLVKQSDLTYKYDLPQEIPCNKDFERGAEITDVPPVKTYEIECWTKRRGVPGAYNTPITITAYILRRFNGNDYETERYVEITPQTGHVGFSSTDDEYIESEDIPVTEKDKFTASVNWKIDSDIASSSARLRLFRFVLNGDDGSWWILGRPADTAGSDETLTWYDTSGWTTNTGRGASPITFNAQDEREWQTISYEAPPIPVSGKLYIWLNQVYSDAGVPTGAIINYANLDFAYLPLINGSYRKYTGQKHTVAQDVDNRNVREKQVYLSDSPRKLFKGALLISDSGAFPLAGLFYNGATEPDGPVNQKTYGEIQAFDVWNQVNRTMVKLDGNVDHTATEPDLISKWTVTDANENTDARIFLLLHYELDTHYCSTRMFLIEVSNSVVNKVYTGHSFKYLTTDE